MSDSTVHVYIVEDEPSIGAAYARLLRSAKVRSSTFQSVEEFMLANCPDEHACVISDICMGGLSGLELPGILAFAGRRLPVIIVTAHDTPETREAARQAGVVEFFRKPVDDQDLLDAVQKALRSG
jgi:FixJ family two-component response regulator